MQKFTVLEGVVALLERTNIDTDLIIPKQYLTTIARTGLGKGLFHELRVGVDGKSVDTCIFNQEPYVSKARILVAGDNFGCGSSREHAVWALADYGIRCVISSSLADIFFSNCIKNGVLPAKVSPQHLTQIMAVLKGPVHGKVELSEQKISIAGQTWPFTIDPGLKQRLLEGWDDIAITLLDLPTIEAFEASYIAQNPWIPKGTSAIDSTSR